MRGWKNWSCLLLQTGRNQSVHRTLTLACRACSKLKATSLLGASCLDFVNYVSLGVMQLRCFECSLTQGKSFGQLCLTTSSPKDSLAELYKCLACYF